MTDVAKTQLEIEAEKFARAEGMPESELTLLEKFRSKVLNFRQALENLERRREIAQRDPALRAEYDALMQRGSILTKTVGTLAATVDKVVSFFRGIDGLSALGIVPLLPVAAITGALAVLGKFTYDAYELSKRLDAVAALEKKGYSPAQAIALVARQFPGGVFSQLGNVLPFLLVGLALFLFLGRKT